MDRKKGNSDQFPYMGSRYMISHYIQIVDSIDQVNQGALNVFYLSVFKLG